MTLDLHITLPENRKPGRSSPRTRTSMIFFSCLQRPCPRLPWRSRERLLSEPPMSHQGKPPHTSTEDKQKYTSPLSIQVQLNHASPDTAATPPRDASRRGSATRRAYPAVPRAPTRPCTTRSRRSPRPWRPETTACSGLSATTRSSATDPAASSTTPRGPLEDCTERRGAPRCHRARAAAYRAWKTPERITSGPPAAEGVLCSNREPRGLNLSQGNLPPTPRLRVSPASLHSLIRVYSPQGR